MTCPYCGSEISDEHIYCDVCGKEFQIVPDFDYEVEEKISKSMEVIKEQVGQDTLVESTPLNENPEEEYFLEEDPNLIESVVRRLKGKKLAMIIVGSVAALLFLLLIVGICHLVKVNSYDYQYNKALSSIEKGNYGVAADYLEKLLLKDNSNVENKMLLANCYIKSENLDSAIIILKEIIAEDKDNIEAYSKIISVYESQGRYDEMNALFEDCEEESVIQYFQSYVALEPVFSVESGVYTEMVVIKLTANANGTIYYTVDGSIPNENCDVYTAPITLEESGIYTISAVFVNHYGVSSDIVTNTYTVDLTTPDAPKVSLESGIYDVPQTIVVETSKYNKVYYTIDGERPNDTSLEYTSPLLLQLGTHIYQFVSYSQDGIPGEVTTCYYTLAMNTLFSGDEALRYSRQFLVNYGFIQDIEGHIEGKPGHNEYSINTAFIYNETPYFLVVEKYVDTLGTAVSTGNLYAFDANDTRFYRAFVETDGSYRVEPILDY